MNAIEAIVYCLGFVNDVSEDGEFSSRLGYDVNKNPHWLSWEVKKGENAIPQFCSECATPFVKSLEPYSM